MKTITQKFNVYNFNELSEEAKEKAISNHYEKEDYFFLEDDILCYLSDNTKVFKNIKPCYSLTYSQGDGLSFSADVDMKAFLERYDFAEYKKRAIYEYFTIKTNQNKWRYCYASANDVSEEKNYYNKNLTNIEDLFYNAVYNDLQREYLELCKDAENFGYSTIEHRMNNEEFEEFCECNGYTFLENGEMYF